MLEVRPRSHCRLLVGLTMTRSTRAAPKRIDYPWQSKSGMVGGTVEYIRADLVRACMPANWREDKEWRAVARALGIKP